MSEKYCILQDDLKDCGVCCLLSIIKYYNGNFPREYLKELTKTSKAGVSALNILKAARQLGFDAFGIYGKLKDLKVEYLPIIAHVLIDKKFGHFVVIYKIDLKKDKILVMDPSKGYVSYSFSSFMNITTNYYLVLKTKQLIPNIVEKKNVSSFLKSMVKKYKHTFIVVFVLSVLYTLLNIVSSYHFKLLYDDVNYLQNGSLKVILIFLVILLFFKVLINLLRNTLINEFNYVLDKGLVNKTFSHIIHLPYLYYRNHTSGDLFTRINDLSKVKELISNLFVSIFVDLLLAVIILIMMFRINVLLTMIIVISLILYSMVCLFSNKIIKENIQNNYKKSSIINNYLIEALSSFETIKNLSIEDFISRRLNNKYTNYCKSNLQLFRNINNQNMIKNIILSLGNLILLYYGIIKINNGISLTELFTLITLTTYLVDPVRNIFDLQLCFLNSKESIRRIKELLEIPTEKQLLTKNNNINNLKGRIEIDQLSYSYNSIDKVLSNISLEIKEGDKVLIYGNSGCGKSTLMQLLIKYLDNNYEGNITIDGYDLKNIDIMSLRKNICYVSQNEYLYSDTVYENITLGRKINYQDFLIITKNIFIDEIVKNTNVGFNYLIENNGENLSGGERARIIIGRSLLQKANIFIYDETFSAIDVEKERKILTYLFNTYPNKTFIIISHRNSNEELYDKKILIEGGYNLA